MDVNQAENKALIFLKSLLSNKTDIDPKYVVGLFCTLLWAIMIGYHLYTHVNVQSELIWANVGLIGACFGLDVINSVKAMSVKSSVASDIAKSDSSSQTNKSASDVIQNDKPS